MPTGPPLPTTGRTTHNSNRTLLQPQQEEFTLLSPSSLSTPERQSASPSPVPMSSAHQSIPPELAHIAPVDDETPGDTTDENPSMNTIESKAAVFAKAI